MRLALLICAILAVSVMVPLPAHAQGAVLPTMTYYSPAQFTDVVCPRKVGTNTLPAVGTLAFDSADAFHCEAAGKDQFSVPYRSVKALLFDDHVREPQSALSRYKVCRSHRLTIVYTDEHGVPARTVVWLPSAEWKIALAVASNKTGLPIQRTRHSDWVE